MCLLYEHAALSSNFSLTKNEIKCAQLQSGAECDEMLAFIWLLVNKFVFGLLCQNLQDLLYSLHLSVVWLLLKRGGHTNAVKSCVVLLGSFY
jgi:hypothetical protein